MMVNGSNASSTNARNFRERPGKCCLCGKRFRNGKPTVKMMVCLRAGISGKLVSAHVGCLEKPR